MKKPIVIFLALMLTLSMLTGCGLSSKKQPAESKQEQIEIVVFAAASMTETLNQIAELYKDTASNVKLTFNFDSSGTLKTQIQEGAVCDVFISAAKKQMDQLDITADAAVNTEGLDFILDGTRVNLLENKVALCVPDDNPKNINSYNDMAEALKGGTILMGMGNSDVPVGQYTQKILTYYNLDEKSLAGAGCLTYGSNVKEVTSQVSEGTVDCGIIYSTDAYSAGLKVVDTATKDMCGNIIYPGAVMKGSKYAKEAQAFLDFLSTKEAVDIFEKVGFTAVK